MHTAVWYPDQPAFLSYETVGPGNEPGFLATDYTDGCDTRWRGQLCLGPLSTAIDLSGQGGTTAVVGSGCMVPSTMNGTLGALVYVNRGTKPGKIKLSDMSSITSAITLGEAGTCAIYTKAGDGTEQVTLCMENTAYVVITTVGNTSDTTSANDQSYKITWMFYAGSDPNSDTGQIAGLGRGAGSVSNLVFQNVLSGTTDMDASNWQQRAVLAGESVTFTGGTVDGRAWILGTTVGPYYLNADFKRFVKLIPELARSAANCRGMASWSVYNGFTFIPLQRSMRTSKNVSYGQSVGVETYRENQSPVQGQHTTTWFSERWGYTPVYNAITDKTYLCAFRPKQEGDWHNQQMSYYPIITLGDGAECNFGIYTGTEGSRTLPTHLYGVDSDMAYFGEGRLDYFPSDTSYPYAAGGSWYGTELRRYQDKLKRPTRIRFNASGLTSTETIAVKLKLDGGTAQTITTLTSADNADSSGYCVVDLTRDVEQSKSNRAFRVQPVITLARGSTTTLSPRVTGPIYMDYEVEEPEA